MDLEEQGDASGLCAVQGQTERLVILNLDCVEALRTLASESVQLVVTSPPYDALRTYGGHPWDFEGTAIELFRVLCDGGVVCWNVGDSVVDGSETLTSAKQKNPAAKFASYENLHLS